MKVFFPLLAGIFLFIYGCSKSDIKEEDTTEFNKMEWMLGIWEGKQGDADIYESWRRKNYRIMEGTGYTTSEGTRVFSQNMRIEQSNNNIFFIIKDDDGEAAMKFELSSINDSTVEFSNSEEGYPNKIIYKRGSRNRMNVALLGNEEEQTEKSVLTYRKTEDYSNQQPEGSNL